MSQSVGYSTLDVIPSAKGFGKALSKDIDPQMSDAGKFSGAKFGKVLGGAALAGFAAAAAGFGMVLKTGFSEAMDASAGVAQLAAGIKSTGNAANVSVKGMTDLAGSIQGFSGQTDDSIVAAQKLLLTFTNIQNNGPDKIFDQATLAAANMAAKMGGDASSNAILLGKALNNPTQGISALTRVGVAFTEGQKASIKAMQDHGDVAGAQKIILKELEVEFGGAAKAAGESLPGQLSIAKRSFEDLSQTVVGGLLPAFSVGLSGINDFVKGVQASFAAGGISQIFTDLGDKISAAWPGIKAKLAEWGAALWAWIQDAVPPMLVKLSELLVTLGIWFATVALPFIGTQLVKWGKAFIEWIGPMIPPFLVELGKLLGALGTWLLSTALPGLVVNLAKWAGAFLGWIVPMIPDILLALGELLLKLTGWILFDALPAIIVQIAKWGFAFLDWIGDVIRSLPGKLLGLLSTILKWAAGVPGKIVKSLGDLSDLLRDAGMSIISGLYSGIVDKFNAVKNFISGIGSWIAKNKGPLDYDRQLLVPHGNAIMSGLNEGLTTGFGGVQENLSSMASRVASQWGSINNLGNGADARFDRATLKTPVIGSLDMASQITRQLAIAEATKSAATLNGGNGADARYDLATSKDIKELTATIAALPKSYQLASRQGMRAE